MPEDANAGSSDYPYCRTTGYLFQSFGFLLTLSTCCWWPASSCWQNPIRSTEAGRVIPNVMKDASPQQVWAMIAVVLSFVSGMGLIVIGLGMQHLRRLSAHVALALTASVGLFFWCYLGFAIWRFPAAGRIILAGAMAVIWTVGFVLAGICGEEMRKNPPPKRAEATWTSNDEDDLRKALSPRSPDRKNQ